MANPLDIVTKPLAFGARQAFNITTTALRTVQALTGGGAEQPAPQQEQAEQPEQQRAEQQAQPRAKQRRPQQRRRNTRPKPLDDVSITRKVETELFRDRKIPKSKINVNTAEGVVFLRGEAKTPGQIKEIERRASEIPEVKSVENLLHLPKTPAPTRADTPREQQHTRRHKTSPTDRPITGRVTAEKPPRSAEPAPDDLAKARKGRQPAPLGSATPEGAKGPVNEEEPVKAAEPGPSDLAEERKGRQPAPLGSEGERSS